MHVSLDPTENVLGGQSTVPFLCSLGLFPAPAVLQNEAPSVEYCPAWSQGVHTIALKGANVDGEQRMQAVAFAFGIDPGLQAEQEEEAAFVATMPEGQEVQVLEPPALYEPGTHSTHSLISPLATAFLPTPQY